MTVIRRGRNRLSGRKLLLIILFLIIGTVVASLGLLTYYRSKQVTDDSKEQIPKVIYGVVLTESLGSDEILRVDQLREVKLTEDARGLNVLSKEMAVGKQLRIGLSSNTLLTLDMIKSEKDLPNDIRRHAYHFIETTDKLSIGDYVDIRISFPNGADFIVLSKKRVLDYITYSAETGMTNSLWLELSEEEILQLSSAAVDAYYNVGSTIYAIEYVDANQEKAIANYPVNDVVSKLIEKDPNITEKAKEGLSNQLRSSVTMQLKEYENSQTYTAQEYSSDASINGDSTNEFLTNSSNNSGANMNSIIGENSTLGGSSNSGMEGTTHTTEGKEGEEENYID
ncbi:MAG TPA: hypothetical protein VHQ24_16765 [Lachnospiraceae bacterium]|nr:hypothetical protein [Lachnospiraceae bacterium]